MPNGYNTKRASEKRNAEFMSDVHSGRTTNLEKKVSSENDKHQTRSQTQKKNASEEIEITAKVTLAQFNAAAGDKSKIFNNTSDELLRFDAEGSSTQDVKASKVEQEQRHENRVGNGKQNQARPEVGVNQKNHEVKQENKQLQEHRVENQKRATCPPENAGREVSVVKQNSNPKQEEPKIINKLQEHRVNSNERVSELESENSVVKQNNESANSTTQRPAEPDQAADIAVPDFASLMSNPKINVTTNMKYTVPKLRPRKSSLAQTSQEAESSIEKRRKLTHTSEDMTEEADRFSQEPKQNSPFTVSIAEESLCEDDEDSLIMPEGDTLDTEDDYLDDEEATALLTSELGSHMVPAKVFPVLINAITGERFSVNSPEFTIGHSKQCDLIIQEAGVKHKVSRLHATIYVRGRDTYMVDHSTNGTFIGSNPKDPSSFIKMMKEQEMQIKNGQYIKFASIVFRFERGEED